MGQVEDRKVRLCFATPYGVQTASVSWNRKAYMRL